jgi:hypothetical protein
MAVLMIIMMSVFMLITVSASSLKDSEMRDMAKNIATYTVEYLRSRNVTSDNNFISTTDWYTPSNLLGKYPGLIDCGKTTLPLAINTSPASASQTCGGHFDSSGTLVSGGGKPEAFYYSLQGYVSLANNPADRNPSLEDPHAKVAGGKYYDITTVTAGVPFAIQFPLYTSNSDAIKNFTALSGYNGNVYTVDPHKVDNTWPEYDPHYTNTTNAVVKASTMAYRGFRVLTSIAARKKNLSDPDQVQYYDVKVTVFWILGSAEHSYSLSTQITTYGVS